MPQVSAIIEAAAALVPNSLYLRATDNQMNMDAGELALKDKTVILYNNLPTIKHKAKAGVQREYPVEVKILQLAEVDDNDANGDAIRAALLPVADLIFDYCAQAPAVSNLVIAEAYEIETLNTVRIYDEVLTGLNLKFSMFFDRVYFCIPEIIP